MSIVLVFINWFWYKLKLYSVSQHTTCILFVIYRCLIWSAYFLAFPLFRLCCSIRPHPWSKILFLLETAVLRIPVLYGEVERLEESAVTVMFDKVQFSNKSANMDHWQQRFPTNVKDVAAVCRQLAEKRMLVRMERNEPLQGENSLSSQLCFWTAENCTPPGLFVFLECWEGGKLAAILQDACMTMRVLWSLKQKWLKGWDRTFWKLSYVFWYRGEN